ncbi:hypothetical protein LTR78_000657 [Recurvomyces mirabilis]|uniref:ZZ-type domain-containing protein n=1 Tax=Recurvomyces mirabilis TaxID=574656 RepID=A0AAE0WY77_9PEZI|nr:hypothetical protein LTR78_000657 [Recurvomyces mirabilis]KAK5162311.1 hypothetical protein LTS14_000658 [Recurvomyces mirabilis]
MDPFSITVGIVGLVDGGLSLSRELKGKIAAFQHAEQEVMELAHEIDLCTTLLDILGQSFDRPENAYPRNVVKQTKRLVEDMNEIFNRVMALLQNFDASARANAKYMIDAGELKEQHSKLKGLQLSFVFMLSVCPPTHPTAALDTATSIGSAEAGRLEGTFQVPITGTSASGEPVTYTAILTLQPSGAGRGPTSPAKRPQETSSSSPDFTEQLSHLRQDQRLKKKLANLASNPFFAKDSFGGLFGTHKSRTSSPRKTEVVEYSYVEPMIDEKTGLPDEAANGEATTYASVPFSTYEDAVDAEPEQEREFADRLAEESSRDAEDILDYLYDDTDDTKATDSGQEMQTTSVRDHAGVVPIIPDVSPPSTTDETPDEALPRPSAAEEFEDPMQDAMRLRLQQSNSPDPSTPPVSFSRPIANRNMPQHPSVQRMQDAQQLVKTTPSRSSNRTNGSRTSVYSNVTSRRRTCDGCDCKIPSEMHRYRCGECFDFEFCEPCFLAAESTEASIWHPHPQNSFTQVEQQAGQQQGRPTR